MPTYDAMTRLRRSIDHAPTLCDNAHVQTQQPLSFFTPDRVGRRLRCLTEADRAVVVAGRILHDLQCSIYCDFCARKILHNLSDQPCAVKNRKTNDIPHRSVHQQSPTVEGRRVNDASTCEAEMPGNG